MRQFIKKTLQFNNKGCIVVWLGQKKMRIKVKIQANKKAVYVQTLFMCSR